MYNWTAFSPRYFKKKGIPLHQRIAVVPLATMSTALGHKKAECIAKYKIKLKHSLHSLQTYLPTDQAWTFVDCRRDRHCINKCIDF